MQHYLGQAFTDLAKPAANANITVRTAGTTNNATIYSDDGITAKSNPFIADTLGHFDFYAASGKYDITITGSQITTYTMPNQVVFDPFEVSANNADTAFVSTNNVPLNSADVGGFWGVSINLPQNYTTASVLTNNLVLVWQFVLPYRVQIGKITTLVVNNAGGTVDVGLYSVAGNLLLNTGGFSGSVATTVTSSIVPVFLNAGVYIFAFTSSVGSLSLAGFQSASNYTSIMDNQTNKKVGAAANSASAGVLPATLGAISFNANGSLPAVFFER